MIICMISNITYGVLGSFGQTLLKYSTILNERKMLYKYRSFKVLWKNYSKRTKYEGDDDKRAATLL